MLNVFDSDAFSLVSLTEAINKAPFVPSRLGKIGLFKARGIASTTAVIEEQSGVLSLIPSVPRGAPATPASRGQRKVRSFAVPHIPFEDIVRPEDIQNVRKFGTDDQAESAASVLNDRLEAMRQSHELTEEWLRAGAIQGSIVDGDGTTVLFNLFTQFGVTETSVDFVLGTSTTAMGEKCIEVKSAIEVALGNATYDHIHAFCGTNWFKRFAEHAEVKYAFGLPNDGAFLRTDPRDGFEYKGIIFEEYRGNIGNIPFIGPNIARFVPVGVPSLFITAYAPADFMETANTIGLPVYAKQEPMPFNRGVKIHTQSNPLPLCTRPAVLVKATTSN